MSVIPDPGLFRQLIDSNGWVVFGSVLDERRCDRLVAAQDLATEACRRIQVRLEMTKKGERK
jgi:hypothetical protein